MGHYFLDIQHYIKLVTTSWTDRKLFHAFVNFVFNLLLHEVLLVVVVGVPQLAAVLEATLLHLLERKWLLVAWIHFSSSSMDPDQTHAFINPKSKNTVCPRSSDPILYSKLLYKMGHYFLDIQYVC